METTKLIERVASKSSFNSTQILKVLAMHLRSDTHYEVQRKIEKKTLTG